MSLVLPNTPEQFLEKVARRLGMLDIDVELELPEIEDSLTDGIGLLSSYIPIYSTYEFETVTNKNTYDLPIDCMYIGWVASEPNNGSSDDLLFNMNRRVAKNMFLNTEYGNFGNYYQVGTLARYLNYYEQQSRILGLDFKWIKNGRKIRVMPTPTLVYRVFMEYTKWKDLDDLEPFENIWLFKYVLAISKQIVGRKRNKYGDSLPLHGGQITLNLDGSTLISEGNEELKALEEELITKLAEPARILTEDNG